MNQNRIRYMSIAILALLLTIGALCIATPVMAEGDSLPPSTLSISGCEELDQRLLGLYDHDHNGLIDKKEMECAGLDYEDNRMLQRDYVQLIYAYEHQCSVISGGGGGGGGGATYPPGWYIYPAVHIRAGDGSDLPATIPVGETFTVLITENGSSVGADTTVTFTLPYGTDDPVTVLTDDDGKVNYKPLITGTLDIRMLDADLVTVAEATVEVTNVTMPSTVIIDADGDGVPDSNSHFEKSLRHQRSETAKKDKVAIVFLKKYVTFVSYITLIICIMC